MNSTLVLAPGTRMTAGILLLTIVAVESGGWLMLRIVRGEQSATSFQQAFFRAGHAHAGVLVILALVSQILISASHVSGLLGAFASNGIWAAAILLSGGFFLSATGRNVTRPNGFIAVLYLGVASLAVGVISLGLGLLTA
jgi:Ni,Fe-hydrogenase I cytochrome b subunit